MRKSVKRVIAGVLSAVLSLSLVNFSALSMSLASELSGYEIGVEYSEDNTSATLVGEVSGVKENVQLDKLVDSQGQELDPTTFSQTVEENGTYHFTLYYQETVETQDADQPTTEEKTQELEVVVNGIGKPKADQPAPTATPEVLEGVQMGTEDAKDAPSPFVEKVESMTAAPKTVPLNVLQRNMAQARATKWIEIRADESDYKLQSVPIEGGPLVAGAAGLPSVAGRAFKWADYTVNGTEISRAINGLYDYNGKWYYTVDTNFVDGGDAGTIYLGYELPADATVRLHYEITSQDKKWLNAYGSNGNLATDFQMYLNGLQNYSYLLYAPGTKIVLDFVMPVNLSGLTISISNVGEFNISSARKLENNELTENQIWQTSDLKYTLVFTMPDKDVDINFNGTPWTNSDTRNFALGSDFTPGNNEVFNDTSFSDFYGDYSGSFFKSIPYNVNNSPGIVENASLTHVDGGVQASPRTSFQVYNQGSSTQLKTLQFAQGSFKSNQMVGFTLRMDRRDKNGAYSWKANSLVMNVYVGVPYTWSTTNYRQYTIQLAHTNKLGVDSTRNTYLDCGAMVKTVCWQWDENSYFYRIYVYNMTHNFTLYDRPAKTDKTNYVITEMNGFEVAEPGKYSVGDLSVSFAADYNIYDAGAYPIHVNDDWTMDWLGNQGVNLRQKQLYLRPKYGYTAPKGNISNPIQGTSLHGFGQVLQRNQSGQAFWIEGLYHFQLQSDTNYQQGNGGTPMKLSFNSVPMQLQVGYYANQWATDPYYNPGVTLSVSGNSFYTIEQTTPPDAGNRKLKGYEVWIKSSFNKENDVSGTLYTDDFKIPCPNSSDELWSPTQGMISFSDVYDALQSIGRVTVNEVSQLRFVPVYLTEGEAAVQVQYEIVEQTAFAPIDNNSAGNRNLTTEASNPQDINAISNKKDLNAYVGSIVNLTGNKKWFQDEQTGKYYLYNEKASRPIGTVTAENRVAASLEYLLAAKIQVDVNTLGTGNNGDSWNQSQQNNLYTSVNNFNHTFDLGNLDSITVGTKDGQEFTGWGIKDASGNAIPIDLQNMTWSNSNALNFYMIGENYGDSLWPAIFNSGTCTLVAMWKSDTPAVTSADDTITNKPGDNITILDTLTREFEVIGTFKYGDGTASEPEINDAFNSGKLKIALLIKDPEVNNVKEEWEVRYSKGSTATFGDPVIKKADGSSTFTIRFGVNEEAHTITDKWSDGANFRIFAWTDSNSGSQNLDAAAIAQALNDANGANPYEGKVPSVNVFTEKVYKIEGKTGTQNISATGSENSLQLTTTFRYAYDGARYPGTSFTQTMLGDLIGDGTIQVKLERRTTADGAWTVVNTGTKPITAGGDGTGTINFNYTLTGNIFDYHNNEFRVKVWTEANGTAEESYPSHTFTVDVDIKEVTLADGSKTNENGENITILDQVTTQFEVVGTFKYGDGTASQQEIRNAFDGDKLKIALLIKDPEVNNVEEEWGVRYSKGDTVTFGEPIIEKADGSDTFTVTFRVNGSEHKINEAWSDGANFRIFAWTETNQGGADLTATAIAGKLNEAAEGVNPYDGTVPSMNVFTKKVYQIGAKEEEQPITPKATDSDVALTTTFHYDFDTARYPGTSFTEKMLEALIGDGTIKVKLERKTPTADWSEVTGLTNSLTAGADGTGTITFNYTLSGSILAYDKNQFRVKVWTAANGSTEENYPYHTFTVNTSAEPIKNKGGVEGPVAENPEKANVGGSLTLEASFRYGDGTTTAKQVDELYRNGKVHIALLKKDPPEIWPQTSWRVLGSDDVISGPDITDADSAQDFKVSVQVSDTLGAWFDDGAQFRIYVWTDANGTKENGTSITGTDIVNVLNETPQTDQPDIRNIPWEHFNLSLLYRIRDKAETAPFPAEATQSDVALTTTFHYDYDTGRYPNGFDPGTLQTLIDEGDIQVRLEKKTTADGDWTLVEDQTDLITAGANGTINFSYTLKGKFYSYDNQQFKVSVWTAVNGTTYPSHTFTVDASPSKIHSADGSTGNQVIEIPILIKDGQAEDLTVTAEFMYGDGSAPAEDIDKMVKAGLIHIALLIKDPTTGGEWQVRYPVDGTADFAGPNIAAGKSGTTFQVTFTEESSQLTGMWSDGAEFLIYAWTETNRANLKATDIRDDLNNTQGEKPYQSLYAGEVPSVYTYTTKLYKIADKSGTSTETADVLDKTLTLTTTFHYNYDTNRYPSGFDQKTLETLIADGDIQVKLEKKTTADASWTPVTVEDRMFTTDGQGNITFTYTISAAKISDFLAYEGNQFKVSVWTAANGEPYPSHTFTVDITVDAISNEGGATSSQPEKVEGNVGGGLKLEASFRYGDGTATADQVDELFRKGKVKIALLKIDPDLEIDGYTVSWRNVPYDGSEGAIPEPKITQKDGSTDFTVTFEQVSQSLNGTFDDGARFRIYVWTDTNATNKDGSSITIDQIASDLNKVEGGAEPTITALPWVHYNLSLLYKVTNNSGDVEDTIEVLSTATSIQLSGTFKYSYDGTRYWKGFSAETLKTLIDGNKFSSKVEYQKKGENGWTQVPGAQVTLTAAESGGGIINFSYAFTDANGSLEGYDGAQFKVTVWTDANGTDESTYPVYTITVTYIADPSTYVNIPQYVILEDDKSKVADIEGNLQDGYAGKSAQVTYNTSAGTQVKPEVTVKIKSGVKLQQGSHTGPEMENMGIGIYDGAGKEINPESNGYSTLGTLSESNPTITFWMNVWRGGAMKNEQYYATVDYLFELSGTTT